MAVPEDSSREFPSTAAIAGHPLHPMIVPFPIAYLVGALLTDLAASFSDDLFWPRASIWLVGAGLLTGIIAATLGALDFLTMSRVRQLRSAWIHGGGNVVVLALALVNFVLRVPDAGAAVWPWGLLLSLLTVALLGVTGWYGGELSYRHRIGVTSDDRDGPGPLQRRPG